MDNTKTKISVYTITDGYRTLGYFTNSFVDKLEFAQRVKEEYDESICVHGVYYCYLRKVPHYELNTILVKSDIPGKGAFKATVFFPGGNL